VDDDDYERINVSNWRAKKNKSGAFYAVRTDRSGGKCKLICMHNEILGLTTGRGVEVDHKNRNSLDNRKANLRTCTHAQNQHNRSKFRNNTSGAIGVCFKRGKWEASIHLLVDGKSTYLYIGRFSTKEEAAQAYDAEARRRGEFAVLNGNDTSDNGPNPVEVPALVKAAFKRPKRARNTNSSGYLGVSWHKASASWRVRLRNTKTGRDVYVGYFKDVQEAARAYNAKAIEIYGDLAVLNVIKDF
jgi:hypothetical protein